MLTHDGSGTQKAHARHYICGDACPAKAGIHGDGKDGEQSRTHGDEDDGTESCRFVPEFTFCPDDPADQDRNADFDEVFNEDVQGRILQ